MLPVWKNSEGLAYSQTFKFAHSLCELPVLADQFRQMENALAFIIDNWNKLKQVLGRGGHNPRNLSTATVRVSSTFYWPVNVGIIAPRPMNRQRNFFPQRIFPGNICRDKSGYLRSVSFALVSQYKFFQSLLKVLQNKCIISTTTQRLDSGGNSLFHC